MEKDMGYLGEIILGYGMLPVHSDISNEEWHGVQTWYLILTF